MSTFWFVEVLVCQHIGLSTFWSVDVSVCRRFGLSTFWLSTFRFVDVLTSYLQKGPLKHIKAWVVTKMVIILQTTYPNGFLQWFFFNFAIQEFYFLNIIYILLCTDPISLIFFQHLNMLTRACHHWCLASNIVHVSIFEPVIYIVYIWVVSLPAPCMSSPGSFTLFAGAWNRWTVILEALRVFINLLLCRYSLEWLCM